MEQETASLTERYGPEFERGLLWLLVHDETVANRVSAIDPNWVQDPSVELLFDLYNGCRKLYNTQWVRHDLLRPVLMKHMARLAKNSPSRKTAVDALKLLGKMNKQLALDPSYKKFVIDELSIYVTRRSMFLAMLKSATYYERGEHDRMVETMQSAMLTSIRTVAPGVGLEYGDPKAKLLRYKGRKGGADHIPIGIDIIDACLDGGIAPGMLGFFIGPTGRGKTLALVNTGAAAIAHGKRVVHVTLELSALDVENRYDANISRTAANTLKHFSDRPEVKRALVRAGMLATGKLFIKQWGPVEATLLDIRSYLRSLEYTKGYHTDLLIVDYADLLSARSYEQEHRFALKAIVEGLRQLAIDLKCAVWTASQVPRAAMSKTILSLQDVSECIDKVHIADVVLGLCQTDYEKSNMIMRLVILKNRMGGHEGKQVLCRANINQQRLVQRQDQRIRKGTL